MKLLISTILVLLLTGCAGQAPYTIQSIEGSQEVVRDLANPEDQDGLAKFITTMMNGSQGFYLVNDFASKDGKTVFDISLKIDEKISRYVVLIEKGEVLGYKEIEPEDEVNCQHEHRDLSKEA